MRPLRIALTVAIAAGAAACTLVVGSLNECKTDADCKSKGAGLVCQDSLCVTGAATGTDAGADAGPDAGFVVTDPLCQSVFGAVDGGSNVIRFGAVVPKTTSTGATDQRGVLREHALQLAVEQLNLKHALPNRALVLRVCNDTGDSNKAATEAQELLQEGAVALVTTGSTQTIAIAANGVPAGATMMAISATSTQIGAAGVLPDGGAKRVWSTAISDALQGRVLAGLMLDGGGLSPPGAPFTHPGCIVEDDIAFNGLYATIHDDLLAVDGGPALQLFRYEPGGDIAGTVAQAMSATPDAVVVIAPIGDTAAIFGAWTAPDPVWLFTDNSRNTSLYAFDGGLARLAGSEGTGPSTAGQQTLIYSDFANLYKSQFNNVDPSTASYVPNAYDAVLLLAAGALWADSNGGISGAGIAQGLTQLSDTSQAPTPLEADNFTSMQAAFVQRRKVNVAGASGALDFDNATGVAPGPIDVWALAADGGIVTLQSVTP